MVHVMPEWLSCIGEQVSNPRKSLKQSAYENKKLSQWRFMCGKVSIYYLPLPIQPQAKFVAVNDNSYTHMHTDGTTSMTQGSLLSHHPSPAPRRYSEPLPLHLPLPQQQQRLPNPVSSAQIHHQTHPQSPTQSQTPPSPSHPSRDP